MSRKNSGESLSFLTDELLSIRNMVSLALLAIENEADELIPTALETAYVQMQYLIDEYCVVDEREDN